MDHEILSRNTTRFAECVRDCFRDMLGVEMLLEDAECEDRPFAPRRPMVAMIHFSGRIQGDFVLELEEETAARLIGAWSEGMSRADLKPMRGDYGGLFKELLNTAVGMAIPALEGLYGHLTYHPPLVVYGDLDAPEVSSGTRSLRSGAGPIDCCLVLDMAGDDVEGKLVKVMEDLEQARQEMSICYRVLSELVAPTNRSSVDPALLAQAEQVLLEVREMLESSGSRVD